MELKKTLSLVAASLLFLGPLAADQGSYAKFTELKEKLGISSEQQKVAQENACHLYIVHHGDTEWTAEDRLQGWTDIPLSNEGRLQMIKLAKEFSSLKIGVIYSSSLIRAVESAKILQDGRECEVITEPALKGESHGNLEGLKKDAYEKDPHYIQYKSLSSEDKIFFPVSENGLSKADVALRAIPAIKEICRKHPGQNVIIVTHGGVLKFLNFLLGNYTPEQISEVPHGEMLRIDGDGEHLNLREFWIRKRGQTTETQSDERGGAEKENFSFCEAKRKDFAAATAADRSLGFHLLNGKHPLHFFLIRRFRGEAIFVFGFAKNEISVLPLRSSEPLWFGPFSLFLIQNSR